MTDSSCVRCGGKGYIAEPYTHPKNPFLDGWVRIPCGCFADRMDSIETENADLRARIAQLEDRQ
jgi:hypothetical protein